MSLRVYNTLTREKEPFQPVEPGKVKMYLCGPTVYKPPHIGHMVGPVIFDAIKRYLLHSGYQVTWVVNITDVEDKLIEASNKFNRTVDDLADQYGAEYLAVLRDLGIDTIDHFPKASEHIAEIIQISQTLIEKGFAYAVDGNVWFDVSKDDDYGRLSRRKVEEAEAGNRTLESAGKRNPADFALWKSAKEGEPSWDSPWGAGRPGWHIECSAMAMKYLGETFDMHGGGMDLMFPHHENEIAQSECCTGKTFARYWMHNGLTRIRTKLSSGEWADEKMSGSLGNVVSARELIDTHGSELLRYFLLSTHYRRPIEFTDEVMANAKKGLSVFVRLFERVQRLTGHPLPQGRPSFVANTDVTVANVTGFQAKFFEMMDDDFNTAGAIGVMHELAGEVNRHIEQNGLEKSRDAAGIRLAIAGAQTLRDLGQILGLFRQPLAASSGAPAGGGDGETVKGLMELMIALRAEARQSKNFAMADRIRDGLGKIGLVVEDRAGGTEWRKAD